MTGDGPTMSLLGLMSWAGLGLIKELGRRDWVSELVEDLERFGISDLVTTSLLGRRTYRAMYCD